MARSFSHARQPEPVRVAGDGRIETVAVVRDVRHEFARTYPKLDDRGCGVAVLDDVAEGFLHDPVHAQRDVMTERNRQAAAFKTDRYLVRLGQFDTQTLNGGLQAEPLEGEWHELTAN